MAKDRLNSPAVAIIILHWGDPADTQALLASLAKIDYPDYRVFLVDQTLALNIPLPGNCELIKPPRNLGFAGGNNLALKQIMEQDFDYALLLNNDTLVQPDFLTRLVEALQADPKAAAAGPTITYASPADQVWFAGGSLDLHRGESWHRGVLRAGWRGRQRHWRVADIPEHSPAATQFLNGCCLLVRLEALRDIGLLDERYFVYFEDADWNARATAKGYRLIYQPQARVVHKVSTGLGVNSPTYLYYYFRNRLLFIRDHVRWPWKLWAWAWWGKDVGKEKLKILLRYRRDYGAYFGSLWAAWRDNARRRYGQQ